MATTITAGNSTNGAAAIAPDNTGILELKTGSGAGTTALTLGTSQQATFAGQASFASQVTFSNQLNLAAGTAAAAKDYLTAKGGMDLLTEAGTKKPSSENSTAAGLALMGLITKRRSESMARRDTTTQQYANGGVVKGYADGGRVMTNAELDAAIATANLPGGPGYVAPTKPVVPEATEGVAQTTSLTGEMKATTPTTTAATQATAPTEVTATGVAKPSTAVAAPSIAATTSQNAIEKQLENLKAEQGTVSTKAQTVAAEQVPTTTAVAGVQAAQGEAAKVAPIAERTAQAGEMVSGTAVDQGKVATALPTAA